MADRPLGIGRHGGMDPCRAARRTLVNPISVARRVDDVGCLP
jgi:hypothetical protein